MKDSLSSFWDIEPLELDRLRTVARLSSRERAKMVLRLKEMPELYALVVTVMEQAQVGGADGLEAGKNVVRAIRRSVEVAREKEQNWRSGLARTVSALLERVGISRLPDGTVEVDPWHAATAYDPKQWEGIQRAIARKAQEGLAEENARIEERSA